MIDSLSRGVDCQRQFLLITRARVIIIQFPTNRYNKISITLVLRDISRSTWALRRSDRFNDEISNKRFYRRSMRNIDRMNGC